MTIDLFLQNDESRAPRDQVRIERLAATPYPDGRRIKVEIDVTPFRERPNLEIAIRDQNGKMVSGSSVIATMIFKMEFVLHLRDVTEPAGDYIVEAKLYYDDILSPQDTREITLNIPRT
jgi:hypothetical protein